MRGGGNGGSGGRIRYRCRFRYRHGYRFCYRCLFCYRYRFRYRYRFLTSRGDVSVCVKPHPKRAARPVTPSTRLCECARLLHACGRHLHACAGDLTPEKLAQ